jgi:hypothetical protein
LLESIAREAEEEEARIWRLEFLWFLGEKMPGLYRADARALVWRRAGMVDGVAGVGESRQPDGVCRKAGGGAVGRRWGQRERHGWVFLFYFNKIR